MNKIVAVVITGILGLSLAGCSDKKEAVDTANDTTPTVMVTLTDVITPTPTIAPTATPTPVVLDRVVAVTDDTYSEEFQNKDGVTYLTIGTSYPILKGNSEAIEIINERIQKRKNDYIAYAKEDNDVIYEETININEDSMYPFSFSQNYSITYNKNNILNIVYSGYDYTGGAHGMPLQESEVYDLCTGEQLKLADFLAVEEKTFHDRLYAEFEKRYNENPDNFFEGDSLTYMNDGITLDMNFHLGRDGITYYFYPYEVSFYAAGFIETTIPWSDPILKNLDK